jgi:hypothetical protein
MYVNARTIRLDVMIIQELADAQSKRLSRPGRRLRIE